MRIAVRRVVLLVEDDPTLQQAVVKRLSDMGLDVLTARDFQSAVAILEGHIPDLVCVDVSLPRESGYDLCEHVRRDPRLADVPILLLSERAFPQDMAHAEEVGANAFLRKPFTMQRLAKYVETLVERATYPSRPSVRRLGP